MTKTQKLIKEIIENVLNEYVDMDNMCDNFGIGIECFLKEAVAVIGRDNIRNYMNSLDLYDLEIPRYGIPEFKDEDSSNHISFRRKNPK